MMAMTTSNSISVNPRRGESRRSMAVGLRGVGGGPSQVVGDDFAVVDQDRWRSQLAASIVYLIGRTDPSTMTAMNTPGCGPPNRTDQNVGDLDVGCR